MIQTNTIMIIVLCILVLVLGYFYFQQPINEYINVEIFGKPKTCLDLDCFKKAIQTNTLASIRINTSIYGEKIFLYMEFKGIQNNKAIIYIKADGATGLLKLLEGEEMTCKVSQLESEITVDFILANCEGKIVDYLRQGKEFGILR
jgi:hypothetical protein